MRLRQLARACHVFIQYSVHEGTKFTPFELVYGRIARLPSQLEPNDSLETYNDYVTELVDKLTELRKLAVSNLINAKDRYKYYYDKKLKIQDYKIGDFVNLLKMTKKHKFDDEYTGGPYEIIELLDNNNIKILIAQNKTKITHKSYKTCSNYRLRMTKNEYTITPLRDNPGIFYKTIGELRTTKIYWKMITYIDITDIFGILGKIQKKIELTIQQCDNISKICIAQKQLVLLLAKLLNKIVQYQNHIRELIGDHRIERAPFEFIGQISKILFGTMTTEDAYHINSAIQHVENKTNDLHY